MSFSENLRAELYYRNITIKELSFRTNIPYSTMLTYVRDDGNVPNVYVGCKIAKALDVSVEYLVNGEEFSARPSSSQEVLSKTTKTYVALEKIDSLLKEALDCIESCK